MDTKKFEFFCSRVAAGVGILILGFLSLYSIFYTRKFPTNHDEMPVQTWGSPVSLVILVVLLIAAVGYLGHWILKNEKHRERNIRLLLAFTCIYAAVYGIVWAFACKYHMMWDPQLVSFWGDQLAHGMNDVSASDIDYLSSYPHQMGLIALLELVYRICGPENYHAFQVLNGLGAGAIVYLGCKIIRMTTKRQEPAVYFLLLMLCCHPLYIYVCFVYGEVLSLLIVVIGGFLFYVVWEAKSRYVLPYFIMLIPSAACGWDLFLQKLGRLWEKCGAGSRVRALTAKFQTEKTETICSRVVLLLAGLPSVFLFLYSLIFTTIYESNDLEVPSQTVDPVPLILLFVAASLAALWMAGRWILKKEANRKRNLHILLGVVLVHCAVFCIAWNLLAQSALRADPLYIHAIGGGFALSDLNESAMDYLYTYPHQAGQALLVEIVYRIFGYENFFAFRMVNTLGVLVFVVSGFAITGELFRKDRAQVNFLLLAAGCVPLFVYTNVIYGEVLAIAAVSFGLWMFLRWLREEKLRDLILMILALVFAVYMKNNALIAAVAIILTALIKAVAEHRKKLAVWMIPFLAALLLSQPAMTKLYEHRSGWPLDRGMPKTLWVAMGLQGEGMTAGWWNEYPDKVYKEQAGYNPEEADAIAKEAIAFSVKGFAEHPKAAVSFFGHKFVSQWNDAGYGCEVSAGSQDTPRLEFWMNGYQSLIFLGACAFAVLAWKRRYRIEACLPVLILLGGYLFHLAWEVKGRYGLFYFVLLLPAAAEGLAGLTEKALKKEKAGENVHEA